ncbi:MAG: TetR/AcrR family transcriptional regulator [Acidobacteriia bacterium]|nr:TetR/AcrR family transcriptional regulator [Terriglobia bacterium]
MGSNVKLKLIDAAVTLFGQYGLYGVTTLELAKKSQVIEGSLYRLFLTREKLYDAAIESVVRMTTDALAQFALDPIHRRSERTGYPHPDGRGCSTVALSSDAGGRPSAPAGSGVR